MVAVRSAEERIWHFGDFIVDADRRLLLRNEHPLAAGPKAFDLLAILLENRGRILSKQFLLDAVWPDAIVDVNNLNQQVAALRRLLDDSSDGWIETIPRVGFRFRAELAEKPNRARRWIAAFTVLMIALVLAAFVPKRDSKGRNNSRSDLFRRSPATSIRKPNRVRQGRSSRSMRSSPERSRGVTTP